MNQNHKKRDFPVGEVRRYLEPGPVVLISSKHGNKTDIMTLGWHCILEFSPSLVGCMISAGNYSFELIRQSKECVINLPTTALADQIAGIGSTSGDEIDKFEEFGLTAQPAKRVKAPLIKEAHANFECKLYDDTLVDSLNFFVFEVVKAHVAVAPEQPETLHYQGNGIFMVSGKIIDLSSKLRRSGL